MTNSIVTTSTKTRHQSPAVARRKMLRSVMKRASIIAKNAYNVHNTSIERIASHGASTGTSEFLSMALTIAWQEQKTDSVIYTVKGKIPRKSMQTIHKALKQQVIKTNADKRLDQPERNYLQAHTMILARNAGKYEEPEMVLAYEIAHNIDNAQIIYLAA